MNRIIWISSVVLYCIIPASAQPESSAPPVTAVRTSEYISIDGVLSEKIWQRPGYTDFHQREPDQGAVGTEKTETWVAYDDEALYIAAQLYDHHPDSVVARLVRRDYVYGDPSDGFIVYLDPFHDKVTGYLFYVSAAGTKADGLIENDGRFELSWDAVWEGVARRNSKGFVVEMKIPFSQLRFKDLPKQVWGIDFERYIGRKNETIMVAYTPRNGSGFVSRFPDLVGIEGVAPPTRFEALPYATARAEYIGNDKTNPFNPGHKYLPGGGLDLKMGLGTSITLDGTINPDFGQVELDPAVVNLTDVETSFDEKRPFFTEGVSIFRFGQNGSNDNWTFNWHTPSIFYSRRIGRTPERPQYSLPTYDYVDQPDGTRILGAAKISGRLGDDWKLGMVNALTNREFAQIDVGGTHSKSEIEPEAYYGVYRAQRDFNKGGQGIGFLSTYTHRFFSDQVLRDFVDGNALVAAADGWTFLDEDRKYVITGWAGVSNVRGARDRITALQRSSGHYFQRPDVGYISVDTNAESLSGYAGRFMLNKQKGNVILNSSIGFINPGFEVNDLGYNSYSDVINSHIVTGYRWADPTEYYRFFALNLATYMNFDYGGNKTAQGIWTRANVTLLNYFGGNVGFSYTPTTLNSRRTRGGPLTLNPVSRNYFCNLFSDNRNPWVAYAGGNMSFGESSTDYYAYVDLQLKLTPTFTLEFGPEYSKDFIQAQYVGSFNDPFAVQTYGHRYLFAHLDQTTLSTTVRMDWILSPTLSFQVYVQPFIASGAYSDIKELQRPRSFDFLHYGSDGSTLTTSTNSTGGIDSYTVDADGSGPAAPIAIGNPNFNYRSIRGNAVLRWEYMPGSTLYLVWTQTREDFEPTGNFQFGHSFDRIVGRRPDNIFMLKVSYWMGV